MDMASMILCRNFVLIKYHAYQVGSAEGIANLAHIHIQWNYLQDCMI
jgi:hypothetical protein